MQLVRPLSSLFLVLSLGRMSLADGPIPADFVIRGGIVVDGTAAPGRKADVAVKGDRIVALGTFEADPKSRVIDASGLIVAPGFIDLHTHSDEGIAKPRLRLNKNYVTQGVTTVVTGNCGGGPIDTKAYFHAIESGGGAGSNVISLIPHGSVRRSVIGNGEKVPTPPEMAKMKALIAREMEAGAWGMSTGLIYLPGRYADLGELVELSKVVASHGGIYASHIRNEEAGLLASIDEAIAIGKGAGLPVHISHLKANGEAQWGSIAAACDRIAAARAQGLKVTADQYPYVASSTQLGAMVVPHWARQGTTAEFIRIAADPAQGPRLREEIQHELDERRGGASLRIARYPTMPNRVGRDLVTIAKNENTTPLEIVLDVERHGGAQAISFGMNEDDVRLAMKRDFVATASDGSTHLPGTGDHIHPRAYGTFPRKIRYALDEKVIPLEAAIRSCSGLPAAILGMPDRGTIRVGSHADLLVFDPATFRDAATFDDPTRHATGLAYVFVNGVAAIEKGKFREKLAGRILRPRTDGPADLIVSAGHLWTGDPANPKAEAVASRNGEIVFVGSRQDASAYQGPKTRTIDRPGGLAIPGLIDAHAHLLSLGKLTEQLDLRGTDSPEKVAAMVADRIKAQPGDGWILGRSWDQSLWPGGEFSSAAVLDKVAPDRPVWLTRVDGHAGWANSEAMRRAGITRESKSKSDGLIVRDKDGTPTGFFVDGAMDAVGNVLPVPDRETLSRRILKAQAICFEDGLTGIHDASLSNEDIEIYRSLDKKGLLKLRIYGMAQPPDGTEIKFASVPPIPRRPDRRFEVRAIKVFIDGAMGSRGALLFEPYADDPKNVGLQLTDPKHLEALTTAALKHGWQICTHAIGDRGNAQVLDAYAAARKAVPEARDPRLRVEHAQVVRKADVARFKALGVIASMQPSHSSTDMRWADARLGPDRVQGAYAWRWFLDAGVPLAFGSDFPVEVADPLWGLYAGVTRQDRDGKPPGGWHPDQKLSLEDTLRGFTAGSAFAGFDEGRLGVLKVGMRADLTIVDRDLFTVPAADILKAKVTETIVDGEVVYARSPTR
ncbi:MAG: dan [Planctomycetota bacterium]|nr:dan [Planctomycetota bacterium]